MSVRTFDGSPVIMKKPAVLARSGVFWYTYDDMVKRGFTPTERKEMYSEYRSPAVVIRSKDKYPGATTTIEHTADETGPHNFHSPDQRVTAIVGENIEVDLVGDDVALNGNLWFYTQDGVDFYNAGHKETSGDLKSKVRKSKDPRYDFECVEILSVNGVVLTERGRGGPNVRVQDSTGSPRDFIGGLKMKTGFFKGIFGFGRTQDNDSFKLSTVLMEDVKKVNVADLASVDTCITRSIDAVGRLGDNPTRTILLGAVSECFAHPVEAVANEKLVSTQIDKLYAKCRTIDAEELKKTMDALETKDSEDEEDELDDKGKPTGKKVPKKKVTETKDSVQVIEEAVTKALARVTDAIPAAVDAAIAKKFGKTFLTAEEQDKMKENIRTTDAFQFAVDAAVRKQLGLSGDRAPVVDQRAEGDDIHTQDSGHVGEDAEFILADTFGSR